MLMVDPNELEAWRKYVTTSAYDRTAWLLEARRFRASDTGLSRRQIAELDADNLLGSRPRGKVRGWRCFSFKELVYMGVVIYAKSLGFRQAQMRLLWKAFLGADFFPHASSAESLADAETWEGEFAIDQVFRGKQMLVLLDAAGLVTICEQLRLPEVLVDGYRRPYVVIGLNCTISAVLRALQELAGMEECGLEHLPAAAVMEKSLTESLEARMSAKEKELLEILRNGAYTEIRVTTEDGVPRVVHAKRVYDGTAGTQPSAVLGLLSTGDFVDVSVTKRNGRIVKYAKEDTFKL